MEKFGDENSGPERGREYRSEVIQRMVDENAYFPQTHIALRLAAVLLYIQKRRENIDRSYLQIKPSHFEEDDAELLKIITQRMMKEHYKGGRDIRIPKKDQRRESMIKLFTKMQADAVSVAEAGYALCLSASLKSDKATEVAQEIFQMAYGILHSPEVEEKISVFKQKTEARDGAMLRSIITEIEKTFSTKLKGLEKEHGIVFPIAQKTRFIADLFSPQQIVSSSQNKYL